MPICIVCFSFRTDLKIPTLAVRPHPVDVRSWPDARRLAAAVRVSDKPILVTGAHRSGTTWVGKMLALAPGVAYIHEPFSPRTAAGLSPAGFDRYFTVVTEENEARYRPGLERTVTEHG